MYRQSAFGACLLLLALAGAAPAQRQPGAAEEPDVKLNKSEIGLIDSLQVKELMKYVLEAKNSLSPTGQMILKMKVRLKRLDEKADQELTLLKGDEDVTRITGMLAAPEVRQRLARLAGIEDEKQLTEEFAKFLQEQKVTRPAVVKYRVYKASLEVKDALPGLMKELDQALAASIPEEDALLYLSGGGSLAEELAAIRRAVRGLASSGGAAEPVEPEATGDVRALLKALLE